MAIEVSIRPLLPKEQRVFIASRKTPIVYEAMRQPALADACEYLSQNSLMLRSSLAEHGAILFRNFGASSEPLFERMFLAIPWLRPMSSYYAAEPGRVLLKNTKYIFYTNKEVKTGGAFAPPRFHTENHYSPDVPSFIGFGCMRPSWIGGETGLVNVVDVYRELNPILRQKLESRSFFTHSELARSAGKRYSIELHEVLTLYKTFGVPVRHRIDGEVEGLFYKPSVVVHPITKNPAFTTNYTLEIRGLLPAVLKEFMRFYRGWTWTLHRLLWRYPWIHPQAIRHRFLRSIRKAKRRKPIRTPDDTERIHNIFSPEHVCELATLMRKHYTGFTWKRGDILLIDNLQVAHSGMPGFGPRTLRVILCNPIRLSLTRDAPGRQYAVDDGSFIHMAEWLALLRNREDALVRR